MTYNNERGATLVLVIMVMVVLSILGLSFMTISLSEVKETKRVVHKTQAYYIAQSGADVAANYIIDHGMNQLDKPEFEASIREAFPYYNKVEYTVTITRGEKIRIESQASVNGVSEQVVIELKSKNKASDIFSTSIYAEEALSLGGIEVKGDVQSANGIDMDDEQDFMWSVIKNTPKNYPIPTFDVSEEEMNHSSSLTIQNETHVLTATENNSKFIYNSIDFKNNHSVLQINTQDQDVYLYSNTIDMGNGSTIKVTGEGRVFIYVGDSMTIGKDIAYEPHDQFPSKLIVFLQEGSNVTFTPKANFKGYIYGPTATLETKNKFTLEGSLIIGRLDRTGTNNNHQATMTYVPIENDFNVPSVNDASGEMYDKAYSDH